MTTYNAGDVVLVRFPFTDLRSSKKRPALILSPAEYSARYGDVVVMGMTSQEQPEKELALSDWRQAGLPKQTWLKPVVATLSSAVVQRRLGSLSEADRVCAVGTLRQMIATKFLMGKDR